MAPAESRGAICSTIPSTTASSGSVMCTRSAPATASPADSAAVAPNASSARALASVRFHTVTESPRFNIPSTIALPRSPVPINATFAMRTLRIESTPVFQEFGRFDRFATFAWLAAFVMCAVTTFAQTRPVLRWAGDPEGGAPFVEADPSHPDRVTGFDVEIADLLARGLGRSADFLNITFTSIDQSIARGDADIGMSGIEDTPARRATMAVTLPYYEFREVLSVRDADAPRFRTLADLRGKRIGTLAGTIAYDLLLQAERTFRVQAVSYEDHLHPYSDLVVGRLDAGGLDKGLPARRHRTIGGLFQQADTTPIR